MLLFEINNLTEVERMLQNIDDRLYTDVLEPSLAELLALADFEAQVHVPVHLGILKNSIQQVAPRHNKTMRMANAKLVATAPYAEWVEMGFRPHWVPLHLSYELQKWCGSHLGWRHAKSPEGAPIGRVYMKDQDGGLHWGIMSSGRAQPFMRPAKERVELVAPQVIAGRLRNVI